METNRTLFEAELKQMEDIAVKYDEPMSQHTTFHIGGPADYYVEPSSYRALASVLCAAETHSIPYYVIGRGSNLIFSDKGFRGLVLSTTAMRQITVQGETLTADAGAALTAVAKAAQEHSLTGFEFANGIPGSVGGAVFMNAGAYGGEIAQVLTESTCYDTVSNAFVTLSNEEHEFSYRHSIYRAYPSRLVVSATFRLQKGDSAAIRATMDDLMQRRVTKQPLEYPSAGSAFKRCDGRYTAQMIDEAGLKGYTVGGAQVSEKHAGFIINRGGATAEDVLRLIEYIQGEIRRVYGAEIEPEIVYVPEQK